MRFPPSDSPGTLVLGPNFTQIRSQGNSLARDLNEIDKNVEKHTFAWQYLTNGGRYDLGYIGY